MFYLDDYYGYLTTAALVFVITVLYNWYTIQQFNYWSKRNVPFHKPNPFKDLFDFITKTTHEIDEERHKKYGRIYGMFDGNRPYLMVGDPECLRDILAKDFSIFSNRNPTRRIGDAIIDMNVGSATGEDWKRIRAIMSPSFSTRKIKRAMSTFKEYMKVVLQSFKVSAQNREPVDLRRNLGAFTMNVLLGSAFSTKINSTNNLVNDFLKTEEILFRPRVNWENFMSSVCPKLAQLLGVTSFKASGIKFFRDVTLQMIAQREKAGEKRNDFLQVMMDAVRESSVVQEDDGIVSTNESGMISTDLKVTEKIKSKQLSFDEMVAQCMFLFIAGYNNTATTLTYVGYNLAIHEDIQEKVHKEVTDAIKEANGEVTYEALQSMKYLDNVISETLRLYPPSLRFRRLASSDYKLGNTGITIPKGMSITVPVYAIHKDAKFYPNPEKFDPERFNQGEKSTQEQYAFLPFGAGPRFCLGMKYALIETKVCLSYIICNFKLGKCPKTKVPLEYLKGQGTLQPKDVYISVQERTDNPIKN